MYSQTLHRLSLSCECLQGFFVFPTFRNCKKLCLRAPECLLWKHLLLFAGRTLSEVEIKHSSTFSPVWLLEWFCNLQHPFCTEKEEAVSICLAFSKFQWHLAAKQVLPSHREDSGRTVRFHWNALTCVHAAWWSGSKWISRFCRCKFSGY